MPFPSERRLEATENDDAPWSQPSAESRPGRALPGGPTRRTAAQERRKRRRQSWLQENALAVAAAAILVGFLGLGFGLAQLLSRDSQQNPPAAASVPTSAAGEPEEIAPAAPAFVGVTGAPAKVPATSAERVVQVTSRVLEANYVVEPGDNLGAIASEFGTTIERIAAINNLDDPRMLNIGQELVIPPPL